LEEIVLNQAFVLESSNFDVRSIVAVKFSFGDDHYGFLVSVYHHSSFDVVVNTAFFDEAISILDDKADSRVQWIASDEIIFENSL
jgi:hypothetical protein